MHTLESLQDAVNLRQAFCDDERWSSLPDCPIGNWAPRPPADIKPFQWGRRPRCSLAPTTMIGQRGMRKSGSQMNCASAVTVISTPSCREVGRLIPSRASECGTKSKSGISWSRSRTKAGGPSLHTPIVPGISRRRIGHRIPRAGAYPRAY